MLSMLRALGVTPNSTFNEKKKRKVNPSIQSSQIDKQKVEWLAEAVWRRWKAGVVFNAFWTPIHQDSGILLSKSATVSGVLVHLLLDLFIYLFIVIVYVFECFI